MDRPNSPAKSLIEFKSEPMDIASTPNKPHRSCDRKSKEILDSLDLNTFRDSFRKPSQIYRFLCERWKTHPIYLVRTLSYVSKHLHRPVRKRETSINEIAKKLFKEFKGKRNNNNGDTKSLCQQNVVGHDTVFYFNWICSDEKKTQQRTKTVGCRCPWCERSYFHLDSFMTHLKCCHLRFNFNLTEDDGQPVIELTINHTYDGSYCGFKYPGHDLRRDFRFTPMLPQRRAPTTKIIYFRVKKRQLPGIRCHALRMNSIDESESYMYDDGDADVDVCSGRLYYHTSTCLPVKPNEVDLDSEADMDPEWLCERTQLMIDEFTDVNEGEKEILKLWNLHIMKNYKYKSDNMMPQACLDFVQLHGPTILSKSLFKNFTLHLANLYDFGLIGSGDLLQCIRQLKKMKPTVSNSPTKPPARVKSERNSNEHCQHTKRAL